VEVKRSHREPTQVCPKKHTVAITPLAKAKQASLIKQFNEVYQ
jgi:hypothetical protein